jgi:hypothetical protein
MKWKLHVISTETCSYSADKILVLKRKYHLGDPRRRWEDNITIEFEGIECDGVNWIHLAKI